MGTVPLHMSVTIMVEMFNNVLKVSLFNANLLVHFNKQYNVHSEIIYSVEKITAYCLYHECSFEWRRLNIETSDFKSLNARLCVTMYEL